MATQCGFFVELNYFPSKAQVATVGAGFYETAANTFP